MLLLLCAQLLLLLNVVGSQVPNDRQICRRSSCARSCSCLVIKPKDCQDILQNGCDVSGVYTVFPHTLSRKVSVFCDQTTDGGGWIVFQRRENGSVNFNRTWVDYKFGFGDVDGEFWIGNELLHIMTTPTQKNRHVVLRVEMEDVKNQTKVAVYNDFSVGDENHRYGMVLKGYSGNAGNPYAHEHLYKFSTDDKDSSGHSSSKYGGGWWYSRHSNLNGRYPTSHQDGNYALTWANEDVALKRTEIKFRQQQIVFHTGCCL